MTLAIYDTKVCKSCQQEKNVVLCFLPKGNMCKACKAKKQKAYRKPGTIPQNDWKGLKFDLQSTKRD